MQAYDKYLYHIILDERASISILSSTTCQALGSPDLVPATNHPLPFNRRPSEPLGMLPQLPILLGGKNVCIDFMVVQGPLDFNFLLGRNNTYAMKVVVFTLFRVMLFPHNGSIVTIDQLSFVSPIHSMTANHLSSLNVPCVQVFAPPQHVKYVALFPMHSISNQKDPLFPCSPSLDFSRTIDKVTPSLWALEPDLPLVSASEFLDRSLF